MAKTVRLHQGARRMIRDFPRHQLPKDSAWNLVNLIPDVLGAPLEKRGGWSYFSNDITATKATASYVSWVSWTEYSAASKMVCADEDGEVYTIATNGTVTDIGAGFASLQRPVLHAEKLVIPAADGTTAPKYYDGSTLGNLAGSPPAAKFAAVYKDRTVLANTSAQKTRAYFSDLSDPTGWDTTNTYWTFSAPITGLAALPNALLIFMEETTARIRGTTPPPGTDFISDDPLFSIGCTDARSIAVRGNYAIFANPLGVYVTNGTANPEDLTAAVGLKTYWLEQMAAYDANYTLAAGMFRNYYVISVMNGSTFVDAFMFDIENRAGWRLGNLKATCFGPAVTTGEELYFGLRSAARVCKFSTIFSPASGVKNDADGTAVTYTFESPFYRDRQGAKRWRRVWVAHDTRDASSDNPVLTVSYQTTPEGSYTALSPTLSETTDYSANMPLAINQSATGIGVKVEQSNASSVSRLYDIEAEVHGEEQSRR